jgi:hypothetical protein
MTYALALQASIVHRSRAYAAGELNTATAFPMAEYYDWRATFVNG